MNLFSTIKIRP